MNDKRLYHFVDLKPSHPQKRKRRDIEQEVFIQRHELVNRITLVVVNYI